MKQIIISITLLLSINAFSQDTTKVKNLQMPARLIAYLASNIFVPSIDSLFQVYIDLRPKFRIQNPPNANTLVTIDSIPTTELANLYNYTLSNSDGMGVSALMKARLVSARSANSYLDRLCTSYENFWTNKLTDLIASGQRLLLGR